jgi:oxygen-dependent protoporphyrinogen oxidase
MKRVVIIGGGISGLAAAHRLHELTRERRLSLEITVLEASDRWGGVIQTQRRDGLVLEGGPDAFLSEKPWLGELCRRLGLGDELVGTRPTGRRSFVVHRGRPVALPDQVWLVAPRTLSAAWRLSMLSWRGRARIACEPFVPPRRDGHEESVGEFLRRRFGREACERLGQPMISGITTADPDRLSLRAAMPALEEMERRYGSVIRGLRVRARAAATNGGLADAGGPRYGLFQTLRGGMDTVIARLVAAMPDVHLERRARITHLEAGPPWKIVADDGRVLEAEAVCLALPAPAAARLLASCAADVSDGLRAIPYESVAIVNLACRVEDLARPLEGFGLVAPQCERRRLIGVTFSSVKFAERSPEGFTLLRAFVGGAFHRGLLELGDEALIRMVREELRELLGLAGDPVVATIHRHPEAMPQYHLGHLERVAAIETAAARYPGLWLTGNWLRGVGLPDCVAHAQQAAERIAAP